MAESCGCGCGHGDKELMIATRSELRDGDAHLADVARDPVARAVLERFELNHCCGGHLSLRQGAAAAGADLPALLLALEEATRRAA